MAEDGRVHTDIHFRQGNSRLASSKSSDGTGRNWFNVKRGDARKMYLADPGCILVGTDANAIESRICMVYTYAITGDEQILWEARVSPMEYDMHIGTAAYLLEKDPKEITKTERYFGKQTNHAAQRDERGKTMSEHIYDDLDITVSPQQCDEWLEKYKEKYKLSEYFGYVQKQLLTKRMLTNSWGRQISFEYDLRFGSGKDTNSNAYRAAYSWLLCSDAGDFFKIYGWKAAYDWLKETGRGRVNNFVYDDVVSSVKPEYAYDYVSHVVQSLETTHKYMGVDLSIPSSVTIGLDWGGYHEWKRLPPRAEFEAKMEEMLNGQHG